MTFAILLRFLNKLLVKKNGTAKFLVFFERLFIQIDSLDFNNFFED